MAARAVLVLSANLKYYPLSGLENPSKKQCVQSDTIGHYTYLAQPQPCDCRPRHTTCMYKHLYVCVLISFDHLSNLIVVKFLNSRNCSY